MPQLKTEVWTTRQLRFYCIFANSNEVYYKLTALQGSPLVCERRVPCSYEVAVKSVV